MPKPKGGEASESIVGNPRFKMRPAERLELDSILKGITLDNIRETNDRDTLREWMERVTDFSRKSLSDEETSSKLAALSTVLMQKMMKLEKTPEPEDLS